MRVLTLLLFMLAIFLINAHFIRVGEEENRVWPPIVLALLSLILLLRTPNLLRINWKLLVSPVVLLFALNLVWLGIGASFARLLRDPTSARITNVILAAALVVSAVAALLPHGTSP